MNGAWLKMLLVLSLAGNCAVGGALTYKYIFAPQERPHESLPVRPCSPGIRLSPEAGREMREKIEPARRRIQESRARIVELLRQDEPDRQQIEQEITTITASQADIQRMVMDRLIRDLQAMPPEQKAARLDEMKNPRFWRGMSGRGRGGHGRKGFRASPCPPQPDMPPE